MNAYELADSIDITLGKNVDVLNILKATVILREQADQLAKYKQALESIANEQVELSHDKIKWQNEDHIKWAKEALK